MLGYLFWSKNCKFCYDLMTTMEHQGLIHLFKLIQVDNWTTVEYVKWGLNAVPTLVILSGPNGQNKDIREKKQAFVWVETMVNNRRQSMMAKAQQTRHQAELIQIKNRLKEGLYEYCQHESEGMSDAYAYWADSMEKDIDIAQAKTFLPVGKEQQYSIMTIPENENAKKNKLKKQDQMKMTLDLERSRKDQDEMLKKIAENEQINRVLNADNNIF